MMPLHSYRCSPHGHVSDHLFRMGERPEEVVCQCGASARLTLATTAPIVVAGNRGREGVRVDAGGRSGFVTTHETESFVIREKGKSLNLSYFQCDCGRHWSDVFDERPASVECACGLTCTPLPGVPDLDWFTKMYGCSGGYFDKGLGCWINSLSHRREMMDAHNVVEYGEVGDIHDQVQRKRSERAAHDKVVIRDMLRQNEAGPESAAMKTARDHGLIDSWQPWIDQVGGLDGE